MKVSNVAFSGMLLKGSMVTTEYLQIKVVAVKENLPGINSPVVIEFEPAIKTVWPDGKPAECSHWGVNKTNLVMIAEVTGLDDTAGWRGVVLKLRRVMANNPQTGRAVPSLIVDSAIAQKAPTESKSRERR